MQNEVIDDQLQRVIGPARLAYFTPIGEYPILADRKASFLLAASGLILTVLVFFLEPVIRIVHVARSPATLLLAVAFAAVILLICLAARAAYVGFVLPIPPMPPSLALFRDVGKLTREQYCDAMLALNHREALRDVLHYNYSLAVQGAAKFRLVNRSIAYIRIAIPLWMLLLLAMAVWR